MNLTMRRAGKKCISFQGIPYFVKKTKRTLTLPCALLRFIIIIIIPVANDTNAYINNLTITEWLRE